MFRRIRIKLLKGFLDQPVMPRVVLAQELLATARAGPGAVTQRIVLMVAHDNTGSAMLHHVPHQVQGLADARAARSEEHTSELQSRPHLVCRLLLEKKK